MTKKMKLVKVDFDDKKDLLEFLDKLRGANSREDLDALIGGADDGEEENPEPACDSPMCPDCMWRHGIPEREVGDRVKECVSLLEQPDLVMGFTGLFGIVTTMFRDMEEDDPNKRQLGVQIAKIVAGLRQRSEKFAFATATGENDGEGAKH